MCSVHICDANQARKYNSQYRHRDYATNVLSFPADIPAAFLELHQDFSIGDIIICASIVASEAREQHKEPIAHWAHLVVHGFLHLLGFDHIDEDDANTMEAIEIATLAKLGYTNPYKTVKSDHQTSILLETQ